MRNIWKLLSTEMRWIRRLHQLAAYSERHTNTFENSHKLTVTIWQCSDAWSINFCFDKVKWAFGTAPAHITHILVKCSRMWQGKHFGTAIAPLHSFNFNLVLRVLKRCARGSGDISREKMYMQNLAIKHFRHPKLQHLAIESCPGVRTLAPYK